MNDNVILITGASGGLGNFVTQALLDTGAMVVGVSRKIQQSDFPSTRFVALPGEVSTTQGANAIVEQVLRQFGRLDVLVHLVGGFEGGKTVAETDDASIRKMIDLNLIPVFNMARAAIPPMRKAGRGRIVAVGSRSAVEAVPGLGVYSASKAAMVSLMRTVALENRDAGIAANVILPGTMDTPVNRASDPNADYSKWVDPANVAAAIVWLVSDAGKDVNGAAIPLFGSNA